MPTASLIRAGILGCLVIGAPASGQSPLDRSAPWSEADSEKSDEAMRFVSKAIAASSAGQTEAAIAIAQEGLRFAKQHLGRNDVAANQLTATLAKLLYAQGKVAESEPLFASVLAWNKRFLGEDHIETLAAAQDLAFVFSDQAQFARAEPLLQSAIAAFSRTAGAEAAVTLGSIGNLAILYKNEGRYAEAEKLLDTSLGIAERVFGADNDLTVGIRGHLATLYQIEGRYGESEAVLLGIIEQREKRLGYNDIQTLFSLNNLASLYASEGRHDQAVPLFVRAAEGSDRILGPANDYAHVFAANLGTAYLNIGKLDKAEQILTGVVAVREARFGSGNALTLTAKNNLANVYDEAGRSADAERLYRAVMEGRRTLVGPKHPLTLESLHNLALVVSKQGRFEEAQRYYSLVVDDSVRILGLQHPFTIARLSAATRNKLRNPRMAGSAAADARLLASAIRARRALAPPSPVADAQSTREQKSQSGNFLLLPDATWIGARHGRDAARSEIFASLQDAMIGTTGVAIARAAARSVAARKSGSLAELVRARQDLSDQWGANEALFANAAGAAGEDGGRLRATLATERQRLGARMEAVDARLRAEFPDYFTLVRPEPLDIAATQKLLKPDEAVLLAVPSEFGTHVVAVSRTDFKWVRSDWTRDEVWAAVARLLWDAGSRFDRDTAFELHQQLVAPLADVLAGKRHVFIVAGGVLSSLPFGILVTEPPQGSDDDPAALRDTKWFADAHALIVTPSIQSLQFLRNVERRPDEASTSIEFAGFGDPALGGAAQIRGARSVQPGMSARAAFAPGITRAGAGMVDAGQLKSLARLPGTATELEAMRAALGAPLFSLRLGDRATEAAFKSADLSQTRILAVATHGLMAGELRGMAEPGLVFTPPAAPTEQDDGFLGASDVAMLKLDADWVILSACNTAAGDGSEGAPGLSGLARAFFYAGARNLLVSHWPVRDDVAAQITVDAIRRQQSNPRLSRAEALQQAMRSIRSDARHDAGDSWAHPNAWAAFSLVGDGAR